MTVAFVRYETPNGVIPNFAQSPTTVGNQILFLGFTNSTPTGVFTMVGDVSTLVNVPCSGSANFTDGHGDTFSLWGSLIAGTPNTVATSAQNTSTGVWTTGTQSFQQDQPITLTGTPPAGFSTGTTYYVIAAGLSSTTMELSASQGGLVLVPTGTSACTLNTTFQNYNTTQPVGDNLLSSWILEFSGGISFKNALFTVTASPGAGAGAVLGQSVTVAAGDLLMVLCYDSDAFGDPPTVSTAGSTFVQNNNSSIASYWIGTGAAIQPNFTAPAGDTTTPHVVVQVVVSATGNLPGTAPFTPFRQTQFFVTDTVIQT